jgi:predicted nucleic acid-binding protein
MPASGKISLLDVNVWMALAADGHTHHALAARWFSSRPDEFHAFCRVTQMALLRHLTNTAIMGENVQTQAQAWQTYEQFLADPRVLFLNEPPNLDVACPTAFLGHHTGSQALDGRVLGGVRAGAPHETRHV